MDRGARGSDSDCSAPVRSGSARTAARKMVLGDPEGSGSADRRPRAKASKRRPTLVLDGAGRGSLDG